MLVGRSVGRLLRLERRWDAFWLSVGRGGGPMVWETCGTTTEILRGDLRGELGIYGSAIAVFEKGVRARRRCVDVFNGGKRRK